MRTASPVLKLNLILLLAVALCLVAATLATSGHAQQRRRVPQRSAGGAARFVEEADKLAQDNKLPEAIDAYKLAIRLDPRYAPAFEGLGDAYINTHRWDEALAAYKDAVRVAPNDPQAQYDLGYAYNLMGRHGEAYAPLVKAIGLDPQFAEAYYGIGYAYSRGEQYEKAISFLKSAIRLKPDYAEACYDLGLVYARLGKAEAASEQLRKLAAIDPTLSRKLGKEIQPAPAKAPDAGNTKPEPARQVAQTETQPPSVPAQPARPEATPTAASQTQRTAEPALRQSSTPPPSRVEVITNPSAAAPANSPQPEQPTPKQAASVTGNDQAPAARQLQQLEESKPKPPEAGPAPASPPAQVADGADQLKALPVKAKRWALVMGVDKYADQQITPLRGASNDARLLADALIRYGGFPQDQVIVLSTDQPVERQPTRVNILRRLSNLAAVAPKDGLLLISFAGHGMERNGQAFLLPADAQISDQISFLEDTAISVTRMRELIKSTGVGQVMVLLDACRNDPGGRAEAPNPLTEAYLRGFSFDVRNREVQAFATVYATAIGQRAYEYTEKKQGYFTWAIVEGLKGGAANERGEVTLSQLVKFVQETVPKRIAIDLGPGKQQRPFANVEGYRADDLVVALSGPGAAAAGPSAYAPTTMVDPAAIELSFWDSIKNSTNPEDFKSYLDKYPEGQFAALAKSRAQAAKPVQTAPSMDSNSLEMTYWNAIKDSRNPSDFRAFVTKFPNGLFVEIANGRVAMLESEAREREKARLATETDDRARNTHIFDVLDSGRTPGSLTVAPGTLSFEVKKSSEKSARKNVTIQCPEIRRVEQGQSAFVPPHVNLYLSAINGKDRELLFYTSSGGQGLFVNKAIVDITSDVINAIIQACRMTRVNK